MKIFLKALSLGIIFFSFINSSNAQDATKTVSLTVSGTGSTKEQATQNALRSAIEQAFGAFISSKTEILNENLIKDEIVSVSSGNIQEYIVISEIQTPDRSWSNTVKAKVAIDKLTSFCESKGVNVEFKGSLFAINVKQQMLNEENERSAFINMRIVLNKLMQNTYNYQINIKQPINENNLWKIEGVITAEINQNISSISNYLYNTLKGLSCDQSEIENYKSLNKKVAYVAIEPYDFKSQKAELFVFRTNESIYYLGNVFDDLRKAFFNFRIANGVLDAKGYELFSMLCDNQSLSSMQSFEYSEKKMGIFLLVV